MPVGDTFRISEWPKSAMKRFPEASTAIPDGELNKAEVAGPPSPGKQHPELPATVVIIPAADTFLMRSTFTMKRFPEASTAILVGRARLNDAEVAGPPSPELPGVPLPATVVMIPPGDTFRIRALPKSAMKRLPEASTPTPVGRFNNAEAAGPPSPEYPPRPRPGFPLPATVVTILICPFA
jgi:hypothetical protein